MNWRWLRLALLPLPTDDRQERATAQLGLVAAAVVVTVAGGLIRLAWIAIVGDR